VEKPDIGVIYNEYLEGDIFDDFGSSIKADSLNIIIQSRPQNEPMACAEWYIPAAVIAFIGKSYFDGFLKEMGKDHYQSFKDKLSGLTNEVMSKPKIEPFLIGTEGKISSKNPFSMAFAIHSETIDGHTFKLLIPKAGVLSDYSDHVNRFLEFLSDYHLGLASLDSIGYVNEFINPPGGYVFVRLNVESNQIEWVNSKDYR
jgi:hypothetical protein